MATAPITGKAPGRPSAAGRALGIILAAALGGALLWLGAPRLLAAFAMLPGDPALFALEHNRPVSTEDLRTLAAGRAAAARWVGSGRVLTELAQAKLELAQRPETPAAERPALLAETIALMRRGLARSPANPYGWSRLAFAHWLLEGPSEAAAEAWRLSIATGSGEAALAIWRLEFGLGLLAHLRGGDRALLAGQVRHAWRYDAAGLARFAKERGLADFVRRSLGALPPGEAARLEALLAG